MMAYRKVDPKVRAEAKLRAVKTLRDAGVIVDSVYDLVHTRESYPDAIPVLIWMLDETEDEIQLEGIIRALTVKEARPAAVKRLIRFFIEGPESLQWVTGNALSVIADDAVYDELVSLATAKKYGWSRQMLVIALGNMKNPDVVSVLLELLKDEDVYGHAIMSLRKLNAKAAIAAIRPFLNHEKTWIRREAKKAVEKLSKPRAKPK